MSSANGDTLDVAIIQIAHPDQAGLPLNRGCRLEGYEHEFRLALPAPFTGTTVNDLAGGTLFVGAPAGEEVQVVAWNFDHLHAAPREGRPLRGEIGSGVSFTGTEKSDREIAGQNPMALHGRPEAGEEQRRSGAAEAGASRSTM